VLFALETLAKEKYENAVSTSWDCTSFTSSLKHMYAKTPEFNRLLKYVAIKAAASYVKQLVKNSEFARLCQKDRKVEFDISKSCSLSNVSGSDSIVSSNDVDDRPYCRSYDAYGYHGDGFLEGCRDKFY
jgi:hypothetical protein